MIKCGPIVGNLFTSSSSKFVRVREMLRVMVMVRSRIRIRDMVKFRVKVKVSSYW